MIAIILRDNGIGVRLLGREVVTLRDERATPATAATPPLDVPELIRTGRALHQLISRKPRRPHPWIEFLT